MVVKLLIERFSIECRKTKTKEITLANHKGHKHYSEPIKALSNYMQLTQSTGKRASDVRNIGAKSIISSKKAAKIFRNIEKCIDIGECTKTISLLKTLRLRYLQKVQRICGEFLADMPSDLPYILRCDWNFPPRVNLW